MNPVRYEYNTPIFYTSQLDIYGEPDYYGYKDYIVINDTESPLVYDFKMELERKMRPIHRYNRVERFSNTLAQLLGAKGNIPKQTITYIKYFYPKTWNDVRDALKILKERKYYNMIPTIMSILKLDSPIKLKWNNLMFREMIKFFMVLQQSFFEKKYKLKRKYFPSIRFIALKILQHFGAKFDPELMFIRTKRKLQCLNEIWEDLLN